MLDIGDRVYQGNRNADAGAGAGLNMYCGGSEAESFLTVSGVAITRFSLARISSEMPDSIALFSLPVAIAHALHDGKEL
ncbi:MAG TPA: hypothetical protein VLT92_06195 [Burkholderiales bacterium]|nr:hypothetical protein [Burkholderiales bacterium]